MIFINFSQFGNLSKFSELLAAFIRIKPWRAGAGVCSQVRERSQNVSQESRQFSVFTCWVPVSCLSHPRVQRKIFATEKYLWEENLLCPEPGHFVAEVLIPESGAKNVCRKLNNWLVHSISNSHLQSVWRPTMMFARGHWDCGDAVMTIAFVMCLLRQNNESYSYQANSFHISISS